MAWGRLQESRRAGNGALEHLRQGLLGPAATELHAVRDARQIERLAARIGTRKGEAVPLLFFYYSGHGDGRYLHMNGSRYPLERLRSELAGLAARITVLLVDSCKSGMQTRAKGATLGPPYEITAESESGEYFASFTEVKV